MFRVKGFVTSVNRSKEMFLGAYKTCSSQENYELECHDKPKLLDRLDVLNNQVYDARIKQNDSLSISSSTCLRISGKFFLQEMKHVARKNYGLERQNKSLIFALFGLLDYQDLDTTIKIIDFPEIPCST